MSSFRNNSSRIVRRFCGIRILEAQSTRPLTDESLELDAGVRGAEVVSSIKRLTAELYFVSRKF